MACTNGHYLAKSVADDGFIVADSELGDFDVVNLLTPQADLAWRGDSTSAVKIQLNLKALETLDTLALCIHNMTAAASITIDLYDSRVNPALLSVTETVGGATTIPQYKNHIFSFASTSGVQEIDITITDVDNPDAYIQIRRIKLGVLTIPDKGFDFGYTFGFVSGEGYRAGNATWMWGTEEELNTVNELVRDYGVDPDKYARTRGGELLGMDDDILWIGFPDATNTDTYNQNVALVAMVGAELPYKPNVIQGVFTTRIEEVFYEKTIVAPTAFITTWKTTGASETITLPATGANSFIVEWGDGDSELVTTASPSHTYAVAGEYEVSIEGICRKWYQNNAGDKTKIIELSQWGNVGFTALNSAFYGCTALDVTATDTPDVSAITDMSYIFRDCTASSKFNVARWDVSSGTDFSYMFYNTKTATIPVANWDMSSALSLNAMFSGATLLTDIPVTDWDVSGVLDFSELFMSTNSTTIPVTNWNVSSGTDFSYMFYGCGAILTIPVTSWNVSSGTDFSYMFKDCTVATSLPVTSWNVSSGTDFSYMFDSCAVVASFPVDGWNIGAATDMTGMFASSNLGTTEYDLILVAWAAQTPLSGSPFLMNFGAAKYNAGAPATARATLVSDGITITDGGAV